MHGAICSSTRFTPHPPAASLGLLQATHHPDSAAPASARCQLLCMPLTLFTAMAMEQQHTGDLTPDDSRYHPLPELAVRGHYLVTTITTIQQVGPLLQAAQSSQAYSAGALGGRLRQPLRALAAFYAVVQHPQARHKPATSISIFLNWQRIVLYIRCRTRLPPRSSTHHCHSAGLRPPPQPPSTHYNSYEQAAALSRNTLLSSSCLGTTCN